MPALRGFPCLGAAGRGGSGHFHGPLCAFERISFVVIYTVIYKTNGGHENDYTVSWGYSPWLFFPHASIILFSRCAGMLYITRTYLSEALIVRGTGCDIDRGLHHSLLAVGL